GRDRRRPRDHLDRDRRDRARAELVAAAPAPRHVDRCRTYLKAEFGGSERWAACAEASSNGTPSSKETWRSPRLRTLCIPWQLGAYSTRNRQPTEEDLNARGRRQSHRERHCPGRRGTKEPSRSDGGAVAGIRSWLLDAVRHRRTLYDRVGDGGCGAPNG